MAEAALLQSPPGVEVEDLAAALTEVWLPCPKAFLEAAGSGTQAPPTGRAPAAPCFLAPELRSPPRKSPRLLPLLPDPWPVDMPLCLLSGKVRWPRPWLTTRGHYDSSSLEEDPYIPAAFVEFRPVLHLIQRSRDVCEDTSLFLVRRLKHALMDCCGGSASLLAGLHAQLLESHRKQRPHRPPP